ASRKEGVRFRDVTFMPDGESLLGLSDETGEFEFVRIPADGMGADEAITSDGDVLRFEGVPSPDGRRIAWRDNNNDLFVLELDGGEPVRISEDREGGGDMAWSPDGRWLAYAKAALNTF